MSNFKDIGSQIVKAILTSTERETLKAIGEEAKKGIQEHNQLGFTVPKNKDNFRRLPALKGSTVARRKRAQAEGKLSRDTAPAKANNTKSGNLLKNLRNREEPAKKRAVIEIVSTKDRKKAKNLAPDRRVLTISKTEFNRIVDITEKALLKTLKRLGLLP